MGPKKSFLNALDFVLMGLIAVFLLGGVFYAIFAGVINVPGLTPKPTVAKTAKPIVKATVKPVISPVAKASAVASPGTCMNSGPTPTSAPLTDCSDIPPATPIASATGSPLPTLTVSPTTKPIISSAATASPSVTASASPKTATPAPTGSATPDPKKLDAENIDNINKILVALSQLSAKISDYPFANSYLEGRTINPTTPLNILVEKKLLDKLPVDSVDPEGYWIGYYHPTSGTDCSLTVRLRDKTNPAGKYLNDVDKAQGVYVYVLPCGKP